jgi:phosphoglycolate phosphatase
MLKSLIFDLDGTLVDTGRDITAAINHALTLYGQPAKSLNEVTQAIGNGVGVLVERCTPELEGDEITRKKVFTEYQKYYQDNIAVHSSLLPGVEDLLREYSNYFLAVLSNKPEVACRRLLNHFGLSAFFGIIAGGDTFPKPKPHPMGINHILKLSGSSPQQAVMIGDGAPDIITAQNAGIMCIGVEGTMGERGSMKAAGPDYIARDFKEVSAILNTLTAGLGGKEPNV